MPRLKIEGDLLGTSAAARFLGVHRSTLESWRRRSGVIEPTRIEKGLRGGPRYLYSRESLERLRDRIDYDS